MTQMALFICGRDEYVCSVGRGVFTNVISQLAIVMFSISDNLLTEGERERVCVCVMDITNFHLTYHSLLCKNTP